MTAILTFIYANLQWIFSGVGNLLFKFIGKKKKDKASTEFNTIIKGGTIKTIAKKGGSIIDNSITTNNTYNVITPSEIVKYVEAMTEQKIQQNLGLALHDMTKPINLYKEEFLKASHSSLTTDDYNAFKNPDVLHILRDSFSIAARKDSPKWREILSKLIVERIKCAGIDSASMIYNEAINTISILTSDQIRLLSILDITSSLIFTIIKKEILFTEYDLLETFLNEPYVLNNTDIEQLKYCRLISSTFPYEIDRNELNNCSNSRLIKIVNKCQEIVESYSQFGLNQFQLTPVGYAVSQTNLSTILKTEINHLSKAPLQLADLEVRRMFAKEGAFDGDVIAYTKRNY